MLVESPETVDWLRGLIDGLRDTGDCCRYLQGGVLLRLKTGNLFKRMYPGMSFVEFCQDVVGMQYRTAMYLIAIYERAQALGFTATRLAAVGWSKAREFLPLATPETLAAWEERAQRVTSAQLKAEVRKAREAQRDAPAVEVETRSYMNLSVSEEDRRVIEDGIETVAKNRGEGRMLGRGEALAWLVTEWRANFIEEEERALDWHLAQLQRVYGVRLTVEKS